MDFDERMNFDKLIGVEKIETNEEENGNRIRN